MVKWHSFKVDVTLGSDLHCGDRPLGFISRTLYLVPQHIPLYALVPALVARLKLPECPDSYLRLESFCLENIRFLPFFVEKEPGRCLYPWRPEDRKELEAQYIGSTYGTAIHYETRSARENHLFEKETMLARRKGDGKATRLTGFAFFKGEAEKDVTVQGQTKTIKLSGKDCTINSHPITEIIGAGQWGGDRNKGLGRIFGVELTPSPCIYGDIEVQTDSPQPVFTWPAGRQASFLLEKNKKMPGGISGNLEPVSGRRFDPDNGPGLKPAETFVAWQYGWQADNEVKIEIAHDRTRVHH